MLKEMNYITSVVTGIFIASAVLFVSRLIGMPITGIVLAIVLSSFVTSFLYNPRAKAKNNHTTLRGVSASVIFSIIFSIMLAIYYIPSLSGYIGTSDMSVAVAIIIILLITLFGGLLLGTIAGSIGSTFRDLFSVYSSEKE
ncbi:MAG: hypothetical protein BZ135_01075 [Methanosphaera sp. rholeuAM6]|nr:MAG: hypothetical protein BZ135_01075 [Methanosphaera sp. rholeuAM6]